MTAHSVNTAQIGCILGAQEFADHMTSLATSGGRMVAPSFSKLELYRRILAEAADAIAIVDRDGCYIEQNVAHKQLTGYDDADLAGKTPAIHLGEQCFKRIAAELARTGSFEGEVLSIDKSGQMHYIDLRAFSVLDDAGDVVCYVGIKRDITERKRAEQEINARVRELEAVYALTRALDQATAIQQVYDAAIHAVISAVGADRASILIFDDDDVMRFKSWRGLSDAYRAAVEGHSPWARDVCDPAPIVVEDVLADASLAAFHDTITREGIRALGFIPITAEGQLLGKFMLYFNKPHRFTPDEIRVVQALATPVAVAIEQRRADEALRRSERLATAGRLAATIAHEINNPLEAITNLVYLVRRKPLDAESAQFMADIESELARVAQITRQTLGFYRESCEPVEFDLAALAQDVLTVYAPKLRQHEISIHVDLRPARVCAVLGEVRQVIANLTANAIDATPRNGQLKIASSASNGTAVLTVADTGHGISPDHMRRIFEPFFTTKKQVGTGLGLWVSKQLIEKNGGRIDISSSPDPAQHGTTVEVRLPSSF